jgi:hypothetical protein
MKSRLPLLISCLLFPLLAVAQGTVNFSNFGSGGRVYDVGPVIGGTLLNNTNYRVGLYFNPDTNSLSSPNYLFPGSLAAVTSMAAAPFAGRFNGGTVPGAGVAVGSYIAAQIRVWFGSHHPTYESMLAAGNYDAYGNCISGECNPRGLSQPFLIGPLGGAPAGLNNLQNFALDMAPIPEPSALAVLGLGALAWFGPRWLRKPARTPR